VEVPRGGACGLRRNSALPRGELRPDRGPWAGGAFDSPLAGPVPLKGGRVRNGYYESLFFRRPSLRASGPASVSKRRGVR
jgi:hypothetical protein